MSHMSSKENTPKTTAMEHSITLHFSPKRIKYTQAFEGMKNLHESKILNLNQNGTKIGEKYQRGNCTVERSGRKRYNFLRNEEINCKCPDESRLK